MPSHLRPIHARLGRCSTTSRSTTPVPSRVAVSSSPGEYAEMQEFAATVRMQLTGPARHPEADGPAGPSRPTGGTAVTAKAEPTRTWRHSPVGWPTTCWPAISIGAVPAAPPEPSRAAALYAQQCAACHGASSGRGDGPAAAGLDPPPIAFTDAERAAQRTPLALYEVISQGVPGHRHGQLCRTLGGADRWALAFYVGGLANSPQARDRG